MEKNQCFMLSSNLCLSNVIGCGGEPNQSEKVCRVCRFGVCRVHMVHKVCRIGVCKVHSVHSIWDV